MVFNPLIVAALLSIAANAANDWSQPCLGSNCDWDITSGSGSGTVRLVGSQTGISDLTIAAGWQILDCDPASAEQEIRLVCVDVDKGCDHVTQNGAEGTVVRVPNSCGPMPFAVVSGIREHENQTIPASTLKRVKRGTDPTVKGIKLTTNFTAVDPQTHGNVTFFLIGSSLPGVAGNFTVPPPDATALTKRGLSNWAGEALFSIGKFNHTLQGSSPLSVDKTATLFDETFNCSAAGNLATFSGEAKVILDGKVDGQVSYGVVAAGSIIPPKLSEFGLFVGLDSTITGTLGLDTTVTGSIDSPKVPLFETGLPLLDFPKIFSVGPTFSVYAQATATLDAHLNFDVGLAYNIAGAQLFFPPNTNSAPSGGGFTPGNSSLKLSVSPNVTSNGQVAAHLIPTLAFGLDVLGGAAQASVRLDVDTSAALDLSLAAVADAGAGAGTSADDAAFGGCVDVTTGLNVQAGADGSLFGLFDAHPTVSLFSKTFDLFRKCFGSSPARRAIASRARAGREIGLLRRELGCSTSLLGDAVSIAEETVAGSR
ncbi:hypothetical protein C8Q80DRAFT_1091869 [Daedaleopsis nitida]|nr:hypothetical protein C8Q80DRAFT_1091869 [Daedaleopsis nitida]